MLDSTGKCRKVQAEQEGAGQSRKVQDSAADTTVQENAGKCRKVQDDARKCRTVKENA